MHFSSYKKRSFGDVLTRFVVFLIGFLPVALYSQAIGVTAPAATASYCAGSTLNVTYTISGTFSNTPAANVFSAQISDATGSFAGTPVTIGTLTTTNAGFIVCTLPSTLLTSALYRFRVVSSNPAINGSDNGADQLIYSITLNAPTPAQSSFCQNETFTVGFSQSTCPFVNIPSANVYSIELSNASGSFASPLVVGTYTGTTPGTVSCTIPGGTAAGAAYRMRVSSSTPPVTSTDNGSNLVIAAAVGTPSVFGVGRWNVYCYAARNSYSANYMGVYTETALPFNTTTRWGATASPSSANATGGNAYTGCTILPASFSYVYKRTNIACGYYQLDIPSHRHEVYVLINGNIVFTHTASGDAHTNIFRGIIEPTDSIEIRCSNLTGSGNLQLAFTKLNQVTMSAPVTVCAGTSATLIATNTGTLPVNFAWTPTATASPVTGSNVIGTPVVTTTYIVRGTEPVSGCAVFSNSVVVTVNPVPTTNATISTTVICNGFTNSSLAATGANTYSWAPAAGLNTTVGISVIATPTVTTVYTVTGSNNCTSSTAVRTITVRNPPASPSPTAFGSNIWNVYCYNNIALTQYYGYYTENNLSFDSRNRWAASSSPSVALTTTAGAGYSGCNLVPAAHGTISKRTNFACGYYRLDISHDDNYTLFVNGANVASHVGAGDTHIGAWTGFLGNNSTVEVRQINTSAGSSYIDADFIPVAVPFLSPPVTICLGTSTTFTAGNIAGSSYSWTPSIGLSTTIGTISSCSATVSTNYICTVTDAFTGCQSATSVSVTVNPVPATSVTPITSTINCQAETYTLIASGANTYTWSPTAGLSSSTGYSVIASPSVNTVYTVTGSNNCSALTDESTVIVVPLVTPTVFPMGTWNAYVFNSLTYTNYYGYYTEDGSGTSGYDFNTTTRWTPTVRPSSANATNGLAYKGCTVPSTALSMSFKRTGFSCNTYSIHALANKDNVVLLINGVQVATRAASTNTTALWTGVLSNITTVEIRLLQNSATGSLSVRFTPSTVGSSVSVWSGAVSGDWFNSNNWCGVNSVPTATDDVIIYNSGTSFQPTITAAGATCLDLTISPAIAASGTVSAIPAASLFVGGAFGLDVYGDWLNRGFFSPGSGTVSILGTGPKSMSCTSAQTLSRLVINNSGDVTLSAGIHRISGTMNFLSGVVKLNGTLQFLDNSTATNANDACYVQGAVVKFGNEAFTFPIGLGGIYRPISISAPVSVSDNFTAQYFYANPSPPYTSTSKDAGIDHISSCEHWILNRTGGSSIVNVTMTWDANSCGVNALNDLLIARWDAGQVKWKDHGGINITGNTSAGSLQSSSPVTVFSPFTLASKTFLNPLPVELLDFSATCLPDGVQIKWTTASEHNSSYFVVERSDDGDKWLEVHRKTANGNTSIAKKYGFVDNYFADGTIYYRLTQVDKDGKKQVFKTVATQCNLAKNKFNFFPNPASNEISVVFNVSQNDPHGTFKIIDSLGQICYSENMDLKKGTNVFFVPLKLQPGVYLISYSSELFKGQVRKLVVQ